MLRTADKHLFVRDPLTSVLGTKVMPVGHQVMVYGYWTLSTLVDMKLYTATTGTWTPTGDGNQQAGGYLHNDTNAINDEVTFEPVFLTVGTWKCTILALTNDVRGISHLLIDGVEVGTADWYSGSLVYNVSKDISNISIGRNGLYTVAFKVASKNASSSDYWFDPTYILLERTS